MAGGLARLRAQGPSYTFVTLAGRAAHGSTDGSGTAAAFFQPQGVTIDANGLIYVADTNNHTVRRIGSDGVVSTIAGLAGASGGSGGSGSTARFSSPIGVASDNVGTLYVTDNNGIRKIAPDGVVSTLTSIVTGRGIVFDGNGNLYVASGNRIRKIVIATVAITDFAGSISAGFTDATGTSARFNSLSGLAIDSVGNLYVTDVLNYRVRVITPAGVVTTLAQLPTGTLSTDGAYGIGVDGTGMVYVANTVTSQILSITPAGVLSTLAGGFQLGGTTDGAGATARFFTPYGLASDSTGTLYVADTVNSTIRKITQAGGAATVTTFAGLSGGAGNVEGNRNVARFSGPRGVAINVTGTVYVADYNNCTIRSVTAGGVVRTFAGTVGSSPATSCGSTDGTGAAAKFSFPSGVAVDASGNVFVADTNNNDIRKITPAGVVTTFAGQAGTQGSTDDTGTLARFNFPQGVAVDGSGNVYVADSGNSTIRMITPAGVVTTLAGAAGQVGSTDATGSSARFSSPTGVAVDTSGNVYVADLGNHKIRKIASGAAVTTLAGSGTAGSVDATGIAARFNQPSGVAVDTAFNVYVADNTDPTIRKITSAGVVTTIGGTTGFSDFADAVGSAARFSQPYGIAVGSAGNLYIGDSGNNAIRVGLQAPSAPNFTAQPANKTVDVGQTATFTVAASGNLPPGLQWQVSSDRGTTWTDLAETAPYSGTTTVTLTVTGATASLNANRYRAVATNGSGATNSQSATLTVNFLSAVPAALRFGATKTGAAGGLTAVTAPQLVTVQFSGATSTWSAAANQTWVQLSGAAGTGNGQFTVSIVNPGNVIGGSTSLTASITLTPSASNLTSVTIPVTLAVDQTGTSTTGPVGQLETPAQNATGIVGAIGVTGWVVDDIGIASVKIYRGCVANEPQANCQTVSAVPGTPLVFVGDATLVAGARPDVEAAFPNNPAANLAGFGLQVLTNMLPRTTGTFAAQGGQGPLTFYAVATDMEGHAALLSRAFTDTSPTPTSITMNNDNIAKPFGTIDTPGQGGTVSGTVSNFGWTLTPDSNTVTDGTDILVPTNGSTMLIFIDGVATGSVAYNQCRGTVGNPVPGAAFCNDDIANIFGNATPQPAFTARTANATKYRNLDAGRGAIGSFSLDTTTLANGVHTLAWSVTDNVGRADGLGSRYFTVLNSGADPFGATAAELAAAPAIVRGSATALEPFASTREGLWGRTGFDLTTPFVAIYPVDGVSTVQIDDLGRVELWLGEGVDAGYLVANGTLRDLPPGSHLDAASGQFTWAPGPGYLGTYRLAFVRNGERVTVDVTIRPPSAQDGAIQMFVDSPQASQTVEGPFAVAGWAFDPQAFSGAGIDAVHVWAQGSDPARREPGLTPSTSAPIFLGAAQINGARPDVSAVYGVQFSSAGYALDAPALGPGVYDVTIYAHSARTGRWEDARTVRVTVR